jgi:hypothetical protein
VIISIRLMFLGLGELEIFFGCRCTQFLWIYMILLNLVFLHFLRIYNFCASLCTMFFSCFWCFYWILTTHKHSDLHYVYIVNFVQGRNHPFLKLDNFFWLFVNSILNSPSFDYSWSLYGWSRCTTPKRFAKQLYWILPLLDSMIK